MNGIPMLLFTIWRGISVCFRAGWLGVSVLAQVALHGRIPPRKLGQLLRGFFEGMGVTYLKMGQFLALRFDILHPDVCEELAKLFDSAKPVPAEAIVRQLEREFGGPVNRTFPEFDGTPIASASLAQVHLARTLRGERVVVKVQRPGIERLLAADLSIARVLAGALDAFGFAGHLSMKEVLEEFAEFTLREADFRTEGRVADRLRGELIGYATIPLVYWDLSTRRVLTLEYVEGISLNVIIQLVQRNRTDELAELLPGVDLTQVAERLALASLRQLFIIGIFHADPHPGNVLVRYDGSIALVDFGIFGWLSPEVRAHGAGYLGELARGNFEASFHHYLRLTNPASNADIAGFRRETLHLMHIWSSTSGKQQIPARERHLGNLMMRTLASFHRYRIRLDPNMLLFWRVLFVLDSVGLQLSEHIDLVATLRLFFTTQYREASAGSPLCTADEWLTNVQLPRWAPDDFGIDLSRTGEAGDTRLLVLALIGLGLIVWVVAQAVVF